MVVGIVANARSHCSMHKQRRRTQPIMVMEHISCVFSYLTPCSTCTYNSIYALNGSITEFEICNLLCARQNIIGQIPTEHFASFSLRGG